MILRIVVLLGLALAVAPLFAAKGTRSAEKVCQSFYFQSDKIECLKVVAKAKSFNRHAVGICAGLSYSSDKIKCLKAIRNRAYGKPAVKTCESMYFASDKMQCLANGGRKQKGKPAQSSVSNVPKSAKKKLRKALKALERGNVGKARDLIQQALTQM